MPIPRTRDDVLALGAGAKGREDFDRLVPLVYAELRRMAHRQLARERQRHTLDTTGLVHEVYVRLVDSDKLPLESRPYFFGAAARAMRRVLVDAARRRRRFKRGEGRKAVDLDGLELAVDGLAAELVDLDEALEHLARDYPRQARVVECRFFAGLSVEETASALELAERTVKRDWALARAWLFRFLRAQASSAGS